MLSYFQSLFLQKQKHRGIDIIQREKIGTVFKLIAYENETEQAEIRLKTIKEDYKLYYNKYRDLYESIQKEDIEINYWYFSEIKYHLLMIAVKERKILDSMDKIDKIKKMPRFFASHRSWIDIAIAEKNFDLISSSCSDW